jgi:predicted dehydrogenase
MVERLSSCGKTGSSRRSFLQTAGKLAASSALLAGRIPAVHAGEDNTIQLALVGCGGRGTGAVADAFSTTGGPVKLVAMADLFADRLNASYGALSRQFADRVDVPPERRFVGFQAYRQAMDCLRPGDVVILATHAVFRPSHFEYAIQKGLHVFMEKSFAVDAPATRRFAKLAELSEQKNLKVGVGLMWRHSKARQEVIRRIHEGAIGDITMLRIYRMHGPVHVGKRPPQMSPIEFQIRRANCFAWVSGGVFVDYHIHNIDVACWVKGAWPVEVHGLGGRCWPEAGSQFDNYALEYTFADGTKLFVYSRYVANCYSTYSDYAHGTKGSAVIMTSLAAPEPRIYKSHRMVPEELVWKYPEPDCNPYHAEWQILLDAIRNDRPHNEARRAADANMAALMGRMATHSGQLVTWEEAWNSNFQFISDVDALSFDSPPPVPEGPEGEYEPPRPGLTREY